MKKILIIICYTFFLQGISAQTYKSEALNFGLDNYTIPTNQKGALVGKLLFCTDGLKRHKISLAKDTSHLFQIDKNGYIRLKPKIQLLSSSTGFRYGITIKVAGRLTEIELVKDQFIHNKVVAHRGAWKNHDASENSLSSLKNAISLGCEGSEFDVWLSADSALIICHDPTVGGKIIEKTNSEVLTHIKLKNNDYVPTLKQYLLAVKNQNRTRLFLEIKPSQISQERTLTLTDKIVHLIHDLKVQAWVKYISFNQKALLQVLELDPGAKTAYLGDDKQAEELKKDNMWGVDFPYYLFHSNKTLTQNAHKIGLTVNTWTIDSKEEMQYMLNQGVDLITTNDPEMLFDLMKK
jgi:glycerophosphoryl diester phosphodiesterase